MLSITISIGASAAKTFNNNSLLKYNIEKKTSGAANQNQLVGLCLYFEIWTVECSDGSEGLVNVDAYIYDCESGELLVGESIYSDSPNGACGE